MVFYEKLDFESSEWFPVYMFKNKEIWKGMGGPLWVTCEVL